MKPLKQVGKCLQSLVMPQQSSSSHRWRATYYQQEASWHLPHIFSPPVLLNNLLLSFHLYFFLSQVSSHAVSQIRPFLEVSCSQACAFFIQIFLIWSKEQVGKPHNAQTPGGLTHVLFYLFIISSISLRSKLAELNLFQHLEPFTVQKTKKVLSYRILHCAGFHLSCYL